MSAPLEVQVSFKITLEALQLEHGDVVTLFLRVWGGKTQYCLPHGFGAMWFLPCC